MHCAAIADFMIMLRRMSRLVNFIAFNVKLVLGRERRAKKVAPVKRFILYRAFNWIIKAFKSRLYFRDCGIS